METKALFLLRKRLNNNELRKRLIVDADERWMMLIVLKHARTRAHAQSYSYIEIHEVLWQH